MIDGAALAKALAGYRSGAGWVARCPAHDDHDPSLSIHIAVDGKPLVHCHAGCSQAEVIDALRSRGLWDAVDAGHDNRDRHHRRRPSRERDDADDRLRSEAALRVWQSSSPASGTTVATYLRSRGILMAPPLSLRFHPSLKHPAGGKWPVMVSLITSSESNEPIGILRTHLRRDGAGKAPVTPQKMMLGRCRGGAVRLADASHELMIAEGVENALAVMQVTGKPAWARHCRHRG